METQAKIEHLSFTRLGGPSYGLLNSSSGKGHQLPVRGNVFFYLFFDFENNQRECEPVEKLGTPTSCETADTRSVRFVRRM